MVDSWALLSSRWVTIWTQNLIQWLHFPGYCKDSAWNWHCQHKPALRPANHVSTWSPSQILLVEVYPGHIISSKHECQIETEQPYTLTKDWRLPIFSTLGGSWVPGIYPNRHREGKHYLYKGPGQESNQEPSSLEVAGFGSFTFGQWEAAVVCLLSIFSN